MVVYNIECPTIISKLYIDQPYLYEEWLEAQKISNKPVKITIPWVQ